MKIKYGFFILTALGALVSLFVVFLSILMFSWTALMFYVVLWAVLTSLQKVGVISVCEEIEVALLGRGGIDVLFCLFLITLGCTGNLARFYVSVADIMSLFVQKLILF